MKTKFTKVQCWGCIMFICFAVATVTIMATGYLTDGGESLPPWI